MVERNMDGNAKPVDFKIEELSLYRKKKVDLYCIKSTDIVDEGRQISVPTLEGEVRVTASQDQYIMIGPCDDIYPIPRELFESKYRTEDIKPESRIEDQLKAIGWDTKHLKKCRLFRDSFVYAKQVAFDFTVFEKHSNATIYGKAGDYYVASFEDPENRYVICSRVMKETYEFVE